MLAFKIKKKPENKLGLDKSKRKLNFFVTIPHGKMCDQGKKHG